MAKKTPGRTVAAVLWRDRALARCSVDARYLFVGLIGHADDAGRLEADPVLLRSLVFPYDEGVAPHYVEGLLGELAEAGVVRLYEVEGDPYLALPAFPRYQRVRRPDSRLPAPPDAPEPDALFAEPEAEKPSRSRVDTDSLPEGFPPEREALVGEVLQVLQETARGNGHPSVLVPHRRGVALAMMDYPDRDHLAVAREYRAWQAGGRGRPHRDLVRGFRNQLERAARNVGTVDGRSGGVEDRAAWAARQAAKLAEASA